jgi:glutathione S-transferase
MILTESNVINHYLLDYYDKSNIFSPATELDKYLVDKYLGFQSSTQAPFYAQVGHSHSLLFDEQSLLFI